MLSNESRTRLGCRRICSFISLSVHPLQSKVAPETGIWALEDKRDILSGWPGIYILHNNWIEGLGNKMSRAKAKGLWFVDEDKSYDGGLKCITDE